MTESIQAALDHFIAELNTRIKAYFAKNYRGLEPAIFGYEVGRKYVKITMTRTGRSSTSVYLFMDAATGNLYKAATWKAPAQGIRGNVLDNPMSICGPNGAGYARGNGGW